MRLVKFPPQRLLCNPKGTLFQFQVPETPVWLLSRGREKDALDSLCKIRGWTTPDYVREEFDQLIDYSKKLQNCIICYELHKLETQNCEHAVMNPIKRYF